MRTQIFVLTSILIRLETKKNFNEDFFFSPNAFFSNFNILLISKGNRATTKCKKIKSEDKKRGSTVKQKIATNPKLK